MKKIIVACLVLVLCVGLWFFGYYNRKSNDNIPSKELMVTYCQEKGENYATEQIEGYKNTQLMEVWGEPDGHLSGFWGDIWETNSTYNLIVYYDSDGIVEHVKVMSEDDEDKLKYGTWFAPDADNSEYVVVGGEPFTDIETNEND